MTDPVKGPTQLSAQDADLLHQVLPYAAVRSCRAEETLLDTGAEADCFYYVEQGQFRVSYMARKTPIVVASIGETKFIGEIGYFDRKTRTRDIQAVVDARLRVFDRQVMARLQDERPDLFGAFLAFVLRSVCARFRRVLEDRGPLAAYAASLSTGREVFQGLQPIPADLLGSTVFRGISQQLEQFKADMFDVTYHLQKEVGTAPQSDLRARGEAILDDLKARIRVQGQAIDDHAAGDLIWGYIFKEVFPYLMRSRFAERAYYKPKGYAGDYNTIELIYRNRAEGDGRLGCLVDGWVLNQTPARAVRARRRLLHHLLDQQCDARKAQAPPIRIMNLACGPARELCDLFADNPLSEMIEAVCVDIDAEALQFADQCLRDTRHQARVHFMTMNVIKWAVGRTQHAFQPQDIIYSSGLCDYLDDRLVLALIKRCHDQLKPGGVLIIGNFSTANPDRHFMDRLLYWRLLHRDRDDIIRLFGQTPFGPDVEIVAEEQGVNLFALARRRLRRPGRE